MSIQASMENSEAVSVKSKRFKRYFFSSVSALLVIFLIYLVWDYRGPKEINLKTDQAFGLSCLRARDLMVQEYDNHGNLWASRGMLIYRLRNGENSFTKVSRVPTGFSVYWLRNFTLVRRLTIRPECMEVLVTDNGNICALSAGKMWYWSDDDKKFIASLSLRHYGIGDQGIHNNGILSVNDTILYFGEYFQNPDKNPVRIYKSVNGGQTWNVVYEFEQGQIRHIHALVKDPYTEKIWICTGDYNKESMVAWSDDGLQTIIPIGRGSQIWRVCQLIFSEESVYWATDNGIEEMSGIYRWDRESHEITRIHPIDGLLSQHATKLANGTMVFSTGMEDPEMDKNYKTRLWILSDNQRISLLECGSWNHHKSGFWFKYALLRLQRDKNGPALAVTCLNQKEFTDGDLIIIGENTLQEVPGKDYYETYDTIAGNQP